MSCRVGATDPFVKTLHQWVLPCVAPLFTTVVLHQRIIVPEEIQTLLRQYPTRFHCEFFSVLVKDPVWNRYHWPMSLQMKINGHVVRYVRILNCPAGITICLSFSIQQALHARPADGVERLSAGQAGLVFEGGSVGDRHCHGVQGHEAVPLPVPHRGEPFSPG